MFKVGSAWEKPGATGIAHLFEHLMFKNGFIKKLEKKGAVVNAYTQRDATVYYEMIDSSELETVIKMEADRLQNLVITQKDLEAEKKVVLEERSLRIESDFFAQQMEVMEELAFPKHPYGTPVVGYPADIQRLTLEECQEFFDFYYQPKNLLLIVSGDFDRENTRALIQKYYGPIYGKKVPDLKIPNVGQKKPLVQDEEIRKKIERPVETETILVGYRAPSMYSKDVNKLSMLSWALFGMSSSPGYRRLVREKQVALSVHAEMPKERVPYLFLISITMKKGVPASVALEELEKIFEEVKQGNLDARLLERVKKKLVFSTVNETKSVHTLASYLARGEFYFDDFSNYFETIKDYEQTTIEDLVRVAGLYFKPSQRIIVEMTPEQRAYAKGR